MKRTIQPEEIESSGEPGYVRGIVRLEVPSATGGVVTRNLKYVTVWKREGDGAWRIDVDISNRKSRLIVERP